MKRTGKTILFALLSFVILAHFVFVLIKSKSPQEAVEHLKKDTAIKWLTRILLVIAIFGAWKVITFITATEQISNIQTHEEMQILDN